MEYKLIKISIEDNNKITSILRLSDNASIPIDKDNTDFQEYLEWVAKGNTPEPADEVTE